MMCTSLLLIDYCDGFYCSWVLHCSIVPAICNFCVPASCKYLHEQSSSDTTQLDIDIKMSPSGSYRLSADYLKSASPPLSLLLLFIHSLSLSLTKLSCHVTTCSFKRVMNCKFRSSLKVFRETWSYYRVHNDVIMHITCWYGNHIACLWKITCFKHGSGT